MEQDKKVNPNKTEMTFFPNPEERERIALATGDKLVETFTKQTDLTVQFLHELWRTNRDKDIYDCMQNLELIPQIFSLVQSNSIEESMAFFEIKIGVTRDETTSFVSDVLDLMLKASGDMDIHRELTEEEKFMRNFAMSDILDGIDTLKFIYYESVSSQN